MPDLTDEQIAEGLRLASEATARPYIAYYAEGVGPTIQCAAGWMFVASAKATMPNAEYLAHAANHHEAALRELVELRREVTELRRKDAV